MAILVAGAQFLHSYFGAFYTVKAHSSNRVCVLEATGAGAPLGQCPDHKLNVVFYAGPRHCPHVVSGCEWGSRALFLFVVRQKFWFSRSVAGA